MTPSLIGDAQPDRDMVLIIGLGGSLLRQIMLINSNKIDGLDIQRHKATIAGTI